MLLPITFSLRAGRLADHARRHLLRRAVWRLDHRDPDQPAGRILLGRDRDRRLPDGAQGRAGPALATAALGSFFAGTVATFLLALFAPPLAARRAASSAPPEYFSLMVLGLVASIALAHGSILKALAMIVLGPAARPGRHRHLHRHAALHLRHPRALPTGSTSSRSRSASSASPRSCATSRTRRRAT